MKTLRGFHTGIACVICLCGTSFAQVSPEEHAKHHPKGSEGAQSREERGMGGMMGEGMGEMMRSMGVPPPKELYPSLMHLPDLPLEKRAEVQERAHQRMREGAALLATALERLSSAAPGDDFALMQDALAEMREGLAQFESGLAAHRALAEGSAPRNVALQWFKREMSLLPPPPGEAASGPLGLSWFHFFSMVVLGGFALVMVWMYFHKMNRAATLLEALGSAPGEKASTGLAEALPMLDGASPGNSLGATEANRQTLDTRGDCCEPGDPACPSADVGIDAGVSRGLLPMQKRKLCRLRVARIDDEATDVKTFRLVACHGGGIPFSYLPGQFLTLTLPVGNMPIRRSYTISSSPTQGYHCEITVKREDQGKGSRYLHDEVAVGDTVEVQAPSGKFYFTGQEADNIVLIAGGVGITPMMSITRAMTDMAWAGDIYLIVCCADPEHFIFESEVRRLEKRHPNVHVFVAMSRIEQDTNQYRKGRISDELLAEWVPGIASKRIHLCGPPAFMDSVKTMLLGLDVPAASIHTESFGSQQKPRARAKELGDRRDKATAATDATVVFAKSGKSTPLQPQETILEAAERVGVDIEYSCRVGSCGICTVKLLSGQVSMEVDDGLESEDRKAGMVLACQARSNGDVSVDV